MSVKLIQLSNAYCLDVEDGCVHISDEEVCFAFTQEEARALCAALIECGFQGTCEWGTGKPGLTMIPGCDEDGEDSMDHLFLLHDYCPGCGKRIKVVEAEPAQDHPTMVSDGAAGGDDQVISGTPTETLEAALKYCVDLESGTETVWPGDSAFYLMGALLRREIERRG